MPDLARLLAIIWYNVNRVYLLVGEMRAWAIKTKTGYVGYVGCSSVLRKAFLYATARLARIDKVKSYGNRQTKVVPIEIKETKLGGADAK